MFLQLFYNYFLLYLIVNDLQMHFSPFFYFPLPFLFLLSKFSIFNPPFSILKKPAYFYQFTPAFQQKTPAYTLHTPIHYPNIQSLPVKDVKKGDYSSTGSPKRVAEDALWILTRMN